MSPTSYQLLHPAISLYCFILISLSGFHPTSYSRNFGTHPAISLYCFILISLSGFSSDELLPKLRDSPRNIFILLYFNFFVGFQPTSHSRNFGTHPAISLYCFILISLSGFHPTSYSRNNYLFNCVNEFKSKLQHFIFYFWTTKIHTNLKTTN